MHLVAWSASCVPIVLELIVRMSNISISHMLNRACLFPGTTNTFFYYYVLFLLYICVIVLLLLYVFNWIFIFIFWH